MIISNQTYAVRARHFQRPVTNDPVEIRSFTKFYKYYVGMVIKYQHKYQCLPVQILIDAINIKSSWTPGWGGNALWNCKTPAQLPGGHLPYDDDHLFYDDEHLLYDGDHLLMRCFWWGIQELKDGKVIKWTSSKPGSGGGVALEIYHQKIIVKFTTTNTIQIFTPFELSQYCLVHLLRMLATSDKSGITEITWMILVHNM